MGKFFSDRFGSSRPQHRSSRICAPIAGNHAKGAKLKNHKIRCWHVPEIFEVFVAFLGTKDFT